MGKSTKIWRKIVLRILMALLVLILLPPLLIQIPFIQNFVKQEVVQLISGRLGTRVEVGEVNIAWFLDLKIDDVLIEDTDQRKLLQLEFIQLDINEIGFRQNYLLIDRLILQNPYFQLVIDEGSDASNMQFILDLFASTDTTSASAWQISVEDIDIRNGSFVYDNFNKSYAQRSIDYDHVSIDSLYLNISDYSSRADTHFFSINHLALAEKSGFVLDSLSADFRMSRTEMDATTLRIRTPGSRLNLDLNFGFNNWGAFNSFIDSVYVRSSINPSALFMMEIGYFAEEVLSMTNHIELQGDVQGYVSSIKARDLNIKYGSATVIQTDIDIAGLPDIEETFVDARLHNLSLLAADLERFALPDDRFLGSMPEIFSRLGLIKTKGIFTGFYNDFVAQAGFETPLGTILTDLVLKQSKELSSLAYRGNIKALPFNLGALLQAENVLGYITLDLDVEGSGTNWNTLDMKMEGELGSLDLLGENFNSIAVNGQIQGKNFSGDFLIEDELLSLAFSGDVDLREDRPRFDFIAEIEKIRIDKLSQGQLNKELWGAGTVTMNFSGDDIERLEGVIEVNGLELRDSATEFSCRNLMVSFEPDQQRYRAVRLRSDFADVDIEGSFQFSNLFNVIVFHFQELLPSAGWKQLPALPDTRQFARADILLYETDALTKIFLPIISISPNSRLSAELRSDSSNILWNLAIPKFTYSGIEIENIEGEGDLFKGSAMAEMSSSSLHFSDSLSVYNTFLNASISKDSLEFGVRWQVHEDSLSDTGFIRGMAWLPDTSVMKLRLSESQIPLDKNRWTFNKDHFILIDSIGGTFHNVALSSDLQMLRLNGRVDENVSSKLGIQFNNFDLSLLNTLLTSYDFSLGGRISGDLDLMAALGNPRAVAVLNIKDLLINEEVFGDAEIKAGWIPEAKRLDIDTKIVYRGNAGTHYPLEILGSIYPDEPKKNFDLDISMQNLKLATFQPYLSTITSKLSGFVSGDLRLTGSVKNPELSGKLTARRTALLIDFLNVEYSFTHEIEVTPNSFTVKDLVLNDAKGNSAICQGGLYHNGFRDLRLDFELRPQKMEVLNTSLTQNESFYGQAFASGYARISGSMDDILMEIDASTEKGTSMHIPISYAAEVAEKGFITFVDRSKVATDTIFEERLSSGVRLDFKLGATTDADVDISLPAGMGNIHGKGKGDIRFQIDTRGEFNMYGDYELSDGYYDMTLQNLLSRRFELRKGGRITWDGDPYNAELSMVAVYRVRASLSELRPVGDSSDLYNQRIPVNCVIRLSDQLVSPKIKFSFELPESSEEINRIVFNRIDTTNEALVSRQMISLLVLNSFISEEANLNLASGVSSSSFELLSRQLSNWLSQISKDFDVGVNYRPGGELTNEELELALSTQLFNERVLIDGNLGLAGDKNTQAASNLVGDVVVEVKLTDDGRFRVKAFNKSNYVDLIDNKAPYTQGVGIFYRIEFDSFGELWKSGKKQKK